MHPLVGIAITGGGDKLSSVEYTNGDSQDITAGGLVQFYGGVEYHEKGSPFGFQATIGYHVDSTSARNGHAEVRALAARSDRPVQRRRRSSAWASARATRCRAKFTSDGAGYVGNGDFKSQLGGMVMAEWLITPSMGLQLRYVHEKYKLDGVATDGVAATSTAATAAWASTTTSDARRRPGARRRFTGAR